MQVDNEIMFFCKGFTNLIRAIAASVLGDYDLKRRSDVTKRGCRYFNGVLYPGCFVVCRKND